MISFEKLKRIHTSAKVLFYRPASFEAFDIPDDLKEAWKRYIKEKEKYLKLLKHYDFE
jgi:hypothetical protein